MFKTIALKIAEELGSVIKAPIIIEDEDGQIVAAANLKGQLPAASERSPLWWLKRELVDKGNKIGSIWIYGKTEETEIYLKLLVELFQQNYKKGKKSKQAMKEDTLKMILNGECDGTRVSQLLAQSGLNLGQSQYVFAMETIKSEAGQVVHLLRKMWAGENAHAVKMADNILAFLIESQIVEETADELAEMLHQLILDELYVECRIGFSTPADSPAMLAIKFNEAMEALKFIKRFQLLTSCANYSKMNLYALLDSIPPSTLKASLEKYRPRWQLVAEDKELLVTLQKYLDLNLNVSEAARCLFTHRNTLLYRLGKLQKLTGLDYRNFDDMVFLRLLMLLMPKR